MGKDIFEEIIGQEIYVDFQKKDAAENILYAWEFYGMELTEAVDMVFTLDMSTTAFAGCTYGSASDTLYVSFTEEGPLPAAAQLYLRVSEYFDDSDAMNLYRYSEDGSLALLASAVGPENGYISTKLETREKLIITTQTLKEVAVTDETSEDDDTAMPEDQALNLADTSEFEKPEEESDSQSGLSPVMILLAVLVVLMFAGAVAEIIYTTVKRRKGRNHD